MPQSSTVLVADSSDDRRRALGLALYQGGYEVINAVNGEEALRFTAGLDPTLVVAHTGLEGLEPLELHARLAALGLEVPPFLVLSATAHDPEEDLPVGAFYFLQSTELDPPRFLHQVRLLLLARDIGGELGDNIDVLHGGLTRISVGDLLRVLQSFQITGHVELSIGPGAGLWLREGEVIEAHWGSVSGRKAFNRVAALRGGGFVLRLEEVAEGRAIDVDLAALVSDAVDERFQVDELYARLPSLAARPEVEMGDDFFTVEFSELEREVLTRVQQARVFADLVDLVPATDLEALQAIERLHRRGFLALREPEHRVHIVTDSTCDLLPSVLRRHDVTVVPLSILFGSEVFKDGIDIQPDRFYQMLKASKVFPSTSPPTKGEFLETYRRLIGTGDVLSIHISRKQSLTAQHAEEAAVEGATEFAALRDDGAGFGPPSIRVVDSLSNCVGLGMLVLFCARLALRGVALDDLVERIEDIRGRTHFMFIVDTLEYLQRGGRIGKAQALLGSLLGIRPILGMSGGEVVPVDKVRGGRRAQPRLIELMQQRVDTSRPVFAAMAHASAPLWFGRLKELVDESFEVAELFEGEIGPVVGAHVGPGTVGLILFQPTQEELELLRGDG